MAEKAFFFNSINGDRKYQADDFVAYFKELVTNGVFKDVDELNLKVQAYSGMKIRINKGAAIINGYRYLNDSSLDLTVEASDSINDRIDLVVIRLDESNREITAVIKKGTPGAVPTKPSLITDSVVEIPLASIYISKGIVSISDINITDERKFSHSYLDVNHVHVSDDISDFRKVIVNEIEDNKIEIIRDIKDSSTVTFNKIKGKDYGILELYSASIQTAPSNGLISIAINLNLGGYNFIETDRCAFTLEVVPEFALGSNYWQGVNGNFARTIWLSSLNTLNIVCHGLVPNQRYILKWSVRGFGKK